MAHKVHCLADMTSMKGKDISRYGVGVKDERVFLTQRPGYIYHS